MKKFWLLLLCIAAIGLCAACSKGKMEVDKGDPNKPPAEQVSNTPTVTNTPTPAAKNEGPSNTFSMIFLKDADSVWFLTKQEETDVLLYQRETVDRVLYKHGRDVTVYYVGEGDALEWFKLSDEEIIARAAAYPNITFDVDDAMFFQGDEYETVYDYTPEGVCFINGKAKEKKGLSDLPDGGLFTIPVGMPFSSLYHGVMISGFVYDGREIDVGVNEQYFMVCATDILYQMDEPGQVGPQFYSYGRITVNVKEARESWDFVGVDREPFIDNSEVYYDPATDSYIMTDWMFCDTVIPADRFWARLYDPELGGNQHWYVHEGGGGYYTFDRTGESPQVKYEWLNLYTEGTGLDPKLSYTVYAVGNVFLRINNNQLFIEEGTYSGNCYDNVKVGWYSPGDRAITYPFIKTMGHLPVRPDEQVSGELLVDGKDYIETYRKKIAELLESDSETEWTEILYDSGEETLGGGIQIKLTVWKEPATDSEEAHVSYELLYAFTSDVISYKETESFGR